MPSSETDAGKDTDAVEQLVYSDTEMRSRFLLQVVFTLSSLYLAKAQHVLGPGPSCLRWRLHGDGQTRVTFLREEDAPGVRSLVLSLWSDDMRLVSCEVNTDPLVTERYRTLCDRSSTQNQDMAPKFDIRTLLSPGAPCAPVPSRAPMFTGGARRDGAEGKARRKRAWILPGTLWCGRGSRAVRYEQLGENGELLPFHFQTSSCCNSISFYIMPKGQDNSEAWFISFWFRFIGSSDSFCSLTFRSCA